MLRWPGRLTTICGTQQAGEAQILGSCGATCMNSDVKPNGCSMHSAHKLEITLFGGYQKEAEKMKAPCCLWFVADTPPFVGWGGVGWGGVG